MGWRGRLGDGTRYDCLDGATVTGLRDAAAVGEAHSCALLADGTVRRWGDNDRGRLGDDAPVIDPTPTAVQW